MGDIHIKYNITMYGISPYWKVIIDMFLKFICSLKKNGTTLKKFGRIKIIFSMKSILKKLVINGLIRFKNEKFYPTSYKAVLQYDITKIVSYISSVFNGLFNYYDLVHNWYAKTFYNYFGHYCVAMTLANKTKSKIPKVFKKYA